MVISPRCQDVRKRIAEGGGDDVDRSPLKVHVLSCASCRHEWDRQRALIRSLRRLPGPTAPPGLADRLFAGVWTARRRRRQRVIGASMVAASVFVALFLSLRPLSAPFDGAPMTAQIRVPAQVLTTVRIAVNAGRDLGPVRIVLTLPDGFALQGHPGEQRVAWRGRLDAGRSILKLRVIGQPDARGVLSAVLRRNDVSKTFSFGITTTANAQDTAAPQPKLMPLRYLSETKIAEQKV